MPEVRAESNEFFLRRLRTAFWVIVSATVLTTIADSQRPPDELALLLAVKLTMMLVLVGLLWSLRLEWARRHRESIGLLGVSATLVAGALNGIIRSDPTTTILLLGAIALASVAVLPWGVRPQIAVGAIAVVCMGASVGAILARGPRPFGETLRERLAVLADPQVGFAVATALIAVGVLVYVAREFARYRRTIEEVNRELREAERFARSTLDALPAEIAILDEAGAIVGVNRAWQEGLGAAAAPKGEEPVASDYLAILGARHDAGAVARQRLVAGMQEMLRRERDAFAMEYSTGEAGHERWFAVAITRFRSLGPIRLVIAHTEVTERRRAEIELHHAKEAAEVASRAKSDFLANMSHEIRTPMHAVIGLTDIVLDSELGEGQRRDLSLARSAAVGLLAIINDVLDFSQIEAGRLRLERGIFDLSKQIHLAIDTLAAQAQEKGLALVCELSPALPGAVIGDPSRLGQILANLVGNAIKFTERGSVRVTGEIDSLEARSIGVHLAVQDTGIGIPPDAQVRIFERFEQADASSTSRHGGSGLGLAIAKQLTELMGGRIWVESEVGRGSAFHIVVPFEAVRPVGEDALAFRGS